MTKSLSCVEVGEAAKFLERDYNQCFAQLRHHDSQIWNICRFAFTAYIAILGTAIGLYQYSNEPFAKLGAGQGFGLVGAGLWTGEGDVLLMNRRQQRPF